MTKLFYLVRDEMLTGGVIEAQVIAACRARAATNELPPAKIIFLEPARHVFSSRGRVALRRFRAMWTDGRIVAVPYSGRLGERAAARSLCAYVARERLNKDGLIFHCRGPAATLDADFARRFLKRGRVVFDVRGASAYEVIHRLGYPEKENLPPRVARAYAENLELDRRAAQTADWISVVSPGTRRYIKEELNVTDVPLTITPSCIADLSYDENARRQIRREWNVGDTTPVLIYAGRLGKERLPQHLLRVFAAILKIEPAARLIILSYLNQLSELQTLLTAAGVPTESVSVKDLPRDEVVKTLCAADVGIIFYESALRYRAATFPIKLPEYLGAGLALLANETVEQLPELIRENELGWVIPAEINAADLTRAAQDLCRRIATERNELRARALAVCTENFIWEKQIPTLRRSYALSEPPA